MDEVIEILPSGNEIVDAAVNNLIAEGFTKPEAFLGRHYAYALRLVNPVSGEKVTVSCLHPRINSKDMMVHRHG